MRVFEMSHREESCLILLRQSEAIWSEISLHVYLLMTSAWYNMEPALGDDIFRYISTLKSLFVLFHYLIQTRLILTLDSI